MWSFIPQEWTVIFTARTGAWYENKGSQNFSSRKDDELEVIMADRDRNKGSDPQRQDVRSSQGRQGQMGQYHCERCNTNFDSREELNQHELRMHENEMQRDRR